jgi:nucleotide-binding universal stress UspA family protein
MFLETLDHILVPLDLSDASRYALREALGIAARRGSRVTVLTVVDTRFPYPDIFSFARPDEDYFRTWRDTALERIKAWLAEDNTQGVPTEAVVIRGQARREIPAFARESGAQLIVLTTHGAGGVRDSLLGSTTEAVVRTATCPLLVLPLHGVEHDSPLPFA